MSFAMYWRAASIDFRSDADRVGTHIGDETFRPFVAEVDPFVESLGDIHRARSGKSIVAAGFLLERGGDERRDGVSFFLFFLDGIDFIGALLSLCYDVIGRFFVRDQ